tara:strand:+ start:1881 stop:3881 length:2001 start_codon:yes stop_codon:yes gene_type:complete
MINISYFIRTGQAQQSLAKLQAQMAMTTTAIASGSRLADAALMGVSAAFIAMGAGAFVAYNAVNQFQESLTTVRALGGVTEEQMYELADSINEVSAQFGVSGDEIAEGAVMLSKAGLTVDEVNESIGAMTALSKANGIAFEEAARMTVFAVNTFGKEFSEAGQLMDAMQVATQESILDIGDLQKAFAFAGSTAVMSGVSFEQLISIMAVLSNRALQAGISARSVNKMFLDMILNTDELQEWMTTMGMTFEIIKDGKLDIDALMEAFSGQQLTLEMLQGASDVFTVRALRSFGLLIGAADEYGVMLADVTNSHGALQEVVDIQMTSFTALFAKLRQEMLAPLRSPEIMEQVGVMVDGLIELFNTLKPALINTVVTSLKGFSDILTSKSFTGAILFLANGLFKIFSALKLIAWIGGLFNGFLIKMAIAYKLANMSLIALWRNTVSYNLQLKMQPKIYANLIGSMANAKTAAAMYGIQQEILAFQTSKTTLAQNALLMSLGSMLGMGMMIGMIDNPWILFFVGLTSVIMTANTALMVFNALQAAKMGGPTAPVIFAGLLALQAATALAFYAARKKDMAAMEEVAIADTGMFVGKNKSYDTGGAVGPRHQLVYVEPGEQIISKTQGMAGMGGGITVNVGDVYAQDGTDFAQKLADELPRALRVSSYAGGF